MCPRSEQGSMPHSTKGPSPRYLLIPAGSTPPGDPFPLFTSYIRRNAQRRMERLTVHSDVECVQPSPRAMCGRAPASATQRRIRSTKVHVLAPDPSTPRSRLTERPDSSRSDSPATVTCACDSTFLATTLRRVCRPSADVPRVVMRKSAGGFECFDEQWTKGWHHES